MFESKKKGTETSKKTKNLKASVRHRYATRRHEEVNQMKEDEKN